MTTVSMDLMYQVLVEIQKDLKEIRNEQAAHRLQLNDTREQYGLILHHLGDMVGADARQNGELDRLRSRIERIEKRLEIID